MNFKELGISDGYKTKIMLANSASLQDTLLYKKGLVEGLKKRKFHKHRIKKEKLKNIIPVFKKTKT